MSAENVKIVRSWLAALSASTPEDIRAAVAEFGDPDADYYPIRKFTEARPCHGREEFAQFLVQYLEAWSRQEWEIHELIAVGEDRVLMCGNLSADGRGSGMRVEGDLYQCYWLRHGRFFRVEDHLTLGGALHAFGLQGDTLEAAGLRDQP